MNLIRYEDTEVELVCWMFRIKCILLYLYYMVGFYLHLSLQHLVQDTFLYGDNKVYRIISEDTMLRDCYLT